MLDILFQYHDESYSISVAPSTDPDRSESLPPVYTLTHDLSKESDLVDLDYVEALVVASSLVAECVQLRTEEAGDYPYSKEQFIALVNSYIQYDALAMNTKLAALSKKNANNVQLLFKDL